MLPAAFLSLAATATLTTPEILDRDIADDDAGAEEERRGEWRRRYRGRKAGEGDRATDAAGA